MVRCLLNLAVVSLLALAGCHSATGQLVSPKLAGNDLQSQLEFWHSLNDEKVTTNDQAFHGLLLYVGGKDDAKDYAGRVAALKARKMLASNFNEPAGKAVTRGTVAVAIVRLLHIRGGVTLMLLGPIPRYAVRELIFMNLYPPGSAQQTFTGAEFVGIMGRVEDYKRGGPEVIPAAVLSGDAGSLPAR